MDANIFDLQQKCCELLGKGCSVLVVISIAHVAGIPANFSVKVATIQDGILSIKGILPQTTNDPNTAEDWAKRIKNVDARISIHTDGLIKTYEA